MSYNVNNFDNSVASSGAHYRDPTIYRPRFVSFTLTAKSLREARSKVTYETHPKQPLPPCREQQRPMAGVLTNPCGGHECRWMSRGRRSKAGWTSTLRKNSLCRGPAPLRGCVRVLAAGSGLAGLETADLAAGDGEAPPGPHASPGRIGVDGGQGKSVGGRVLDF